MIVIAALIAGGAFGAWRARRLDGSGFDIVQYALVHAILFAILGLFATLLIDKLLA